MQGDPTDISPHNTPSGLPNITNASMSYRTHPASPKTTLHRWLDTIEIFGPDGTPLIPTMLASAGTRCARAAKRCRVQSNMSMRLDTCE